MDLAFEVFFLGGFRREVDGKDRARGDSSSPGVAMVLGGVLYLSTESGPGTIGVGGVFPLGVLGEDHSWGLSPLWEKILGEV